MNIQNYWKDVLEQNEQALKAYFHKDAYVNWHCSNEHFTVDEFIRANCEYPGAWDGEIERIEQINDVIITVTRVFTKDNSMSFHVTSFIKLVDDKIIAVDEYWGDDTAAPQWRQDKHIGTKIKYEYNEKYATLTRDTMGLKLIEFNQGNETEIPYYWYEIVPKTLNKPVGKISIRLGNNYHSYYNGHIGYEVDEEYRGHGFSYQAAKMVLPVAKAYGMEHIYLVCDEDNVASYKTIEKLGAEIVELVVPPKDYFGWYEGIPVQRIYKLELQ